MSQDIVIFYINKFIDDLNEAKPEKSRVPLKDMFMQIRDDLNVINKEISSNHYSLGEKTDLMRESVCSLNELLTECLEVLKKHRAAATRTCLNYYSPAEWLLLAKTREKLLKIMHDIKSIRSDVEKSLSSLGQTSSLVTTVLCAEEKRPETSFDMDESKIFGWDELTKEIIKSLLKKNEEGLNVVAIVGMFGSGKTTLAQKIFLSDEVMDNFPLRLWVWVSNNCSREELVRRLLDNLGVEEEHINKIIEDNRELERVGILLFLLHLELLNKRYLIVFDDVVNVEPWHCELEKKPPEDEKKEWTGRLAYGLPKGDGSAIIITSRREDDARKMVGQGDVYSPTPLLGEDGWALFKSAYAEAMGSTFDDQKLESLKKEIVKKCNGLPIALKAAGERMAKQRGKEAQEAAGERMAKQRGKEAQEAQDKEVATIQAELSSLPKQPSQ